MPKTALRRRGQQVTRKKGLLDKLPSLATMRKYIELEKVYKYTEFCNLLGIKKSMGKNRPEQIEEWKERLDLEFFKGEKIGDDSLVVHKIKTYKPVDRSVAAFSPNAVYPPLFFSILTKELRRGHSIEMTKRQLSHFFGFINYGKAPYEELPDDVKANVHYKETYSNYGMKVSKIIDEGLKSLVKHKFIKVSRRVYIVSEDCKTVIGDDLHEKIAHDVNKKAFGAPVPFEDRVRLKDSYTKEYTAWKTNYYKYTITLEQKMKPVIEDDREQIHELAKAVIEKLPQGTVWEEYIL